MKRLFIPLLLTIGLLTGCAATGPSVDDVAERFRIELEAADSSFARDDHVRASEEVAQLMLDGGCTTVGQFTEEAYGYAFASTCLMYFEDDMTEAQVDYAKRLIFEAATQRE